MSERKEPAPTLQELDDELKAAQQKVFAAALALRQAEFEETRARHALKVFGKKLCTLESKEKRKR